METETINSASTTSFPRAIEDPEELYREILENCTPESAQHWLRGFNVGRVALGQPEFIPTEVPIHDSL